MTSYATSYVFGLSKKKQKKGRKKKEKEEKNCLVTFVYGAWRKLLSVLHDQKKKMK